jgi:glycosyltransferase involved in cell wall biosynthesis
LARVLVYKNQLLPAYETFVADQVAALRRHEAHYVGIVRVAGLPLPDDRTHVIDDGGLIARAEAMSFKLTGHAPRFTRRLRALGPDLVHGHWGADALRALHLATALAVPLVATFHGTDILIDDDDLRQRSWPLRRYVARRQELFDRAALSLAVSSFLRDQMIERGADPSRVVVQYTGVDTARFAPRPADPDGPPTVTFVGRLVARKGCADLIAAMGIVHQRVPDARLVIVGDGAQRPELEALAAASPVPISFAGSLSPSAVAAQLGSSSLLSVPSYTAQNGDCESFGMVFLEAQAVGVPVVATRSGGIPEAVADEETGVLVPERDRDVLATALTELLTDPDRRHRMGQAGARRVREHFDLRRLTHSLERRYDAVLATPGADRARPEPGAGRDTLPHGPTPNPGDA